jgi:hypothetical protein
MKLHGITFYHALTLGPLHSNNRCVDYTINPSAPNNIRIGSGVYFVLKENIRKPVYIGSYQSGIVRRWVYVRKHDLYHFKKKLVAECLKSGLTVRVFAQTEEKIKKELRCSKNIWVNAASIEARLIAHFDPKWNTHGKKQQLKPN